MTIGEIRRMLGGGVGSRPAGRMTRPVEYASTAVTAMATSVVRASIRSTGTVVGIGSAGGPTRRSSPRGPSACGRQHELVGTVVLTDRSFRGAGQEDKCGLWNCSSVRRAGSHSA